MNWRIQLAGWVLLAVAAGMCRAQTSPAAPVTKGNDVSCIPGMKDASGRLCPDAAAKKPTGTEQFPYPGSGDSGADTSTGAENRNGDGKSGRQSQSDGPDAGGPPHKGGVPDTPGASAAKAFPYPGDPNPPKEGKAGSDSSTNGESSSNSGAGENPDIPKLEDKGSTGKKTRRAEAEKLQTDEERETEDLKVAKFYEDDGNLNAAYLRAKDAVKAQPDDSEAHFLLATVAQKMKKRDEAVAEFEAYMKLDPDGLEMKKVKKALEDLK